MDVITADSVRYTVREELMNVLTHGMGIVLSFAGAVAMIRIAAQYGGAYEIGSAAVFGAALILLYLMSTLYHSFRQPKIKQFLRILDHSSIYVLIAGSYTPFTLISLRDDSGWTLFATIWTLAMLGVTFKIFGRKRFSKLSVLLYVIMGWLVLLQMNPLLNAVDPNGITLLITGGIFYTSGIVFYLWHRLPFNHAIWHLFVLAGSVSHFFAVYWYVLPYRSQVA